MCVSGVIKNMLLCSLAGLHLLFCWFQDLSHRLIGMYLVLHIGATFDRRFLARDGSRVFTTRVTPVFALVDFGL